MNTEEARKMASGNEMCFLRVSKPEIDLPPGTDLYSEEVYLKGRENLMLFREKGWVREDTVARMYVYMMKMEEREQYGIVAMSSVQDYEEQKIKRHELTIKKKEDDRTKLSDYQNANLGPLFLCFKDGEQIEQKMMEIAISTEPYTDLVTSDGIQHVLWQCTPEDSAYLENQFELIPHTYIADGHHRAASAFNVGKKRRQQALDSGIEVTG